jgi:hypothetical protein
MGKHLQLRFRLANLSRAVAQRNQDVRLSLWWYRSKECGKDIVTDLCGFMVHFRNLMKKFYNKEETCIPGFVKGFEIRTVKK